MSTLAMLRRGEIQVKRPKAGFKESFPESLTVALTPPPCFTDQGAYLEALDALVGSRLEALREERAQQGGRVLGRRAVRKTAVGARPTSQKERFGRSPTFSALTRHAWRRAVERLRGFRAAYRSPRKLRHRFAQPEDLDALNQAILPRDLENPGLGIGASLNAPHLRALGKRSPQFQGSLERKRSGSAQGSYPQRLAASKVSH